MNNLFEQKSCQDVLDHMIGILQSESIGLGVMNAIKALNRHCNDKVDEVRQKTWGSFKRQYDELIASGKELIQKKKSVFSLKRI